ncbi:hypothetical protein Sjap_003426 [Stephania japonica]|uniref:Uncharacterized protein n=1 Tax=Stephania japonica TaxID=461633 RepID=A0AAP0KNQ9_9MAGN
MGNCSKEKLILTPPYPPHSCTHEVQDMTMRRVEKTQQTIGHWRLYTFLDLVPLRNFLHNSFTTEHSNKRESFMKASPHKDSYFGQDKSIP